MNNFLKEFGCNNSPSVHKTRSKTAKAKASSEYSTELVQNTIQEKVKKISQVIIQPKINQEEEVPDYLKDTSIHNFPINIDEQDRFSDDELNDEDLDRRFARLMTDETNDFETYDDEEDEDDDDEIYFEDEIDGMNLLFLFK